MQVDHEKAIFERSDFLWSRGDSEAEKKKSENIVMYLCLSFS